MILAIAVSLLSLALLLLLSRRLGHTRTTIVRQSMLRMLVIILLLGTLLFWVRYWIVYAISCTPDCIGANLVGWDLEGAVLRNGDFVEANLRGATLNTADLYNADFSGANLGSVNLQNANLRNTRLIGAVLNRTDFRGAEFGDTDLRGAELNEADLTRVDLTRVHLDGVTFDKAKLVEANLKGKNLAGLSMIQADLTGADLSGADLSGSRLSGANLSGARLAGSNLAGAWLNLADLTGADLRNTNLAGANLLGANLASANLSNSQLIGANLIGAHMNGTNLLGADLTATRLLASELYPVDFVTDPLLQALNQLQQFSVVTDADLAGVRFNSQTKWPVGRTSILTEMIGSKFLESTLPITSTQQIGDEKPAISIVSNTTALPLTEGIYRQFYKEESASMVLLDSMASNVAFTTFCSGDTLQMITSNQPFPEDEQVGCMLHERDLITFTVAIQALVVVVNPTNDFLDGLTLDELTALTTANRWSDINLSWPRMPVQRFVPDVETVTFRFWVEKLYHGDVAAAKNVLGNFIPATNAAILVQGVNSDPYAIGVLDYAIYMQSTSGLKLLTVDGQTPNQENVSSGRYQLTQPLYLYADANQIRQRPELQNFLDYYFGHVDQLVEQVGLFSVEPKLLKDASERIHALGTSDKKPGN